MKQSNPFKTGVAVLAGACALLAAPLAQADTYPSRSVTVVVPFSAGGPTDVVARLLAVPMGK